MNTKEKEFTPKQIAFKELFVGTLIYAVVLGFFNDYTSVVYVDSFSTLFLSAIVLELLTYATLFLKGKAMAAFKKRQKLAHKALSLFIVWLVLFLSKFVFIWAIDFAFGDSVTINGFFGILWLVLSVTIIHKAADAVFITLGKQPLPS